MQRYGASQNRLPRHPSVKKLAAAKNIDEIPIGLKSTQNNINIELEAQDAEYVEFIECISCGRKFGRQALAKHKKICKKVFGKKKSESQSKNPEPVLDELPKKLGDPGKKTDQTEGVPAWKKESQSLRQMLKAARNPGKQSMPPEPKKEIQQRR